MAESEGMHAWASLDEALADRSFDIAIVSSPPSLHEEQATACLRAGIGVLVEKPLTLSLASALRLREEARVSGLPLLVGQSWRVRPRELALKELFARGAIGTTRRTRLALVAHPVDVPYPVTPYVPLWEFGIHFLDLLRKRHGSDPVIDKAKVVVAGEEWSASVELSWPDGQHAVFRQGHGDRPFHLRELIIGSRGILYAGQERAVVLGRRVGRRDLTAKDTSEDRLLEALLAAMDGTPTDLDVQDNVRTVALVEAVIRSAKRGEAVRVSDLLAEATRGDLAPAPDA